VLTHHQVAVAPDGNGGIYQALVTSNVMGDMRKRNIQHIHAYCVDNCLVKVADPIFLGFSASKDVDIATKVVRKRNATESVGLILLKNGKPDVVEYSEIDKETAEAKDPKNAEILKFRAANIVNHYYSFRFLESIPEWSNKLPHHVARKKIPYVDTESGQTVKPEKPNGIKLEQFVFDCFPMLELEKFACMEVRREDEFSPLKNARGTGEDDPDTSKRDIMQQGKRWLQAAGATVVSADDGSAGIEVSPLISYGGEGLEKFKGRTITAPAVLEREL
jgi:UDP-N-acetylglucosamine/UDP-N-acetylgalactosamine diphosphorylase